MHFAFLIDPLDTLKPQKDSSLALMVEAARRGHAVSYAEFSDVSVVNGEIFLHATPVRAPAATLTVQKASAAIDPSGPARTLSVRECDRVFIRKDPPFDSQYLALTYLCDQPADAHRFINSPSGVREVNEKLFAARYTAHTPETAITWSYEEACRFAERYERVVLKPIFLGSGQGVVLASRHDPNFRASFEAILRMESLGPVIVQQYLPEGRHGDTRVMLLDGVPLAALGRKPAEGEFRANIAVGGEAVLAELTPVQTAIALEVGADLKKLGILFAGIDFIGSKLIEINVTSPTLIQELRRVSGFDMAAKIIDRVEQP